MDWLRAVIRRMFRKAVNQLVQESLAQATVELNEEIDANFSNRKDRTTLKSGIAMLRARLLLAVRERLY